MKVTTIRRITSICFYLILVIILVMAVLFTIDKDPGKSIFGYRFYSAMSGSMSPDIRKNDEILVKVVSDPASEVAVGDIITYAADSGGTDTVTHRVVEKYENENGQLMFVTKGDANNARDDPIKYDRVIGKAVFTVPFLGGITNLVSQYRIEVICLIVIVFLVYFIVSIITKRKLTGDSTKKEGN